MAVTQIGAYGLRCSEPYSPGVTARHLDCDMDETTSLWDPCGRRYGFASMAGQTSRRSA